MTGKNNFQQLLARLDQVEDHVQAEFEAKIQSEKQHRRLNRQKQSMLK